MSCATQSVDQLVASICFSHHPSTSEQLGEEQPPTMDTGREADRIVIMDEEQSFYQHRSIDVCEEIRVLILEPASSFTAPLVASLFTRPIENDMESPSPGYACVSYC
jgi:hypothetical protein